MLKFRFCPKTTSMQSLWMIFASLMFSCMGVCVKLGSAHLGTAELVLARGVFGVLMMVPILRWQGEPLRSAVPRMQLTRGISGCLALMCYFYTISALPLATAVTLSYTSPFFVALLLALWFRERIRPLAYAAVGLGFVGVVMLLRPTLSPAQWPVATLGLAAGFVSSIAYVSVRELGRAGEPEARTVLYFSAVVAAFGLAWTLLGGGFSRYAASELLAILGIGVFGNIAQFAMTRAYRYGRTILTASLAYTTVIFSSLAGVLVWREVLPLQAWAAIALIVASGVLVSLLSAPARPAKHAPLAAPAD